MCGLRVPGCHGAMERNVSGWWPFRGFEEHLTLKQLRALLCTACYLRLFSELEHVSKKF